jgi:acyl carrier protein
MFARMGHAPNHSSPIGNHSAESDQTDTRKGEMSDQDFVLDKVRQAFKSAFDIDPQSVTMDTTASDIPAWDSVGHLSLASSLEEAFGITLDVDELMEMESVREIVRIITPKVSKKV